MQRGRQWPCKRKHTTVYAVTLMEGYPKTSAFENNRGKTGPEGNRKGAWRMGKTEKERLEEKHKPASLCREEQISALGTGWRKQSQSRGFMPKQPCMSRTSQHLWHMHSRTFKFSVQKINFITKTGSFLTSSLPKPASGCSYSYCHLIVTMVPNSLIFIFSVLNHLDAFS